MVEEMSRRHRIQRESRLRGKTAMEVYEYCRKLITLGWLNSEYPPSALDEIRDKICSKCEFCEKCYPPYEKWDDTKKKLYNAILDLCIRDVSG